MTGIRRFSAITLSLLLVLVMAGCGGGKATKKSPGDSKGSTKSNRGQETGYAMIFDGDTALARDRATDDAKNKLVKKVLGETVEGQSMMQDYELVSMLVQSKSAGIVKDPVVIKQGANGEEYSVTIEGTVEPAAINDAVKAAINTYGKPKFMVLVREEIEGKITMPGQEGNETEANILEYMGDAGFEFVDAKMTDSLMKKEKTKMEMAMGGRISGDVQQLILNSVGAEVIIVGTTTAKRQAENTLADYGAKDMKSVVSIINVKAIDVYTGKILASTSKQAPGLGLTIETAAKTSIERTIKSKDFLGKVNKSTGEFTSGKFIETISRKFMESATNREIMITIIGLDQAAFKDFRDQISNRVRGVQSVIPRGRVGAASQVSVYFAGKTHDFEDELMAKGTKMGFAFTVTESYPNKLTLKASVTK